MHGDSESAHERRFAEAGRAILTVAGRNALSAASAVVRLRDRSGGRGWHSVVSHSIHRPSHRQLSIICEPYLRTHLSRRYVFLQLENVISKVDGRGFYPPRNSYVNALMSAMTDSLPDRMREKPDVSVVVPVYNAEPTLPELIERLHSVLAGCSRRFEIVLVNDGSFDERWRVIRELTETGTWVRVRDLTRAYGEHTG